MIPSGRGVLVECVLVFMDHQGNHVAERQPTFMSAYGSMWSGVAICPTCGTPWAKCTTFTQGPNGPIKREFKGRSIYCYNPVCWKTKNEWHRLPLLDNIMPVDHTQKNCKAILHDTTQMLRLFKPELLKELTHDHS